MNELCTWECLVGLSQKEHFFYENNVSLSHLGVLILSLLYILYYFFRANCSIEGFHWSWVWFLHQMLWRFSMKGSEFIWLCVLLKMQIFCDSNVTVLSFYKANRVPKKMILTMTSAEFNKKKLGDVPQFLCLFLKIIKLIINY